MDRRETWKRVFNPAVFLDNCNIIVQTDGGRRSENCAASSVIIGTFSKIGEHLKYDPLFAQGLFYNDNLSVFQTEAIALEAAFRLGNGRNQE